VDTRSATQAHPLPNPAWTQSHGIRQRGVGIETLIASSDGFLFVRQRDHVACAAHAGSAADEDRVARWVVEFPASLDDDSVDATRVSADETFIDPTRLTSATARTV
jgi:hypothetical protein